MAGRRIFRTAVFSASAFCIFLTGRNNVRAAPDYYAGWAVGGVWNGSGTILRSSDSGNTWFRQGAGQIANVQMGGVCALDPDTAWVVGYSDGYATIYHTADGGNTWERKGSPPGVPDADLFKVSAPDDDHIWAVGVGTILHSGDGGGSWSNQIPAGYESVHLQGVSAPDGSNVWVGGGPESGYPVILKSVDGGVTWTRQSGGDVATPGFDHILGISAVDTQKAWAIGGENDSGSWFILKTTNGGGTWTTQTRGAHDGNEICAVDESTVWGASDSTISWSFDGGATWGEQLSYEYTMGISAVTGRQAWAVSYYGWEGSIWHTADGGNTWTVLTELNGEGLPGLWTVSFSDQTAPPSPPEYPVLDSGDYNGDGVSDIAIFRPAIGLWAVRGLGRIYFGQTGDTPVSGDYDGDGVTDVAVFRPATGLWAVKNLTRFYFGGADDVPAPGYYDGEGRCRVAFFREDSGLWAVRGLTRAYFGRAGDLPVPGDYAGDGMKEIAVFRPATGLWAVRGVTRDYFGRPGDSPLPGAYRWYPSGKAASPFRDEIAIFRRATGLWAVKGYSRYYFGRSGDIPLRGDFTGNSLDDPALFRPSSGLWAVRSATRTYFGALGDIPVTR